MAKKLFAVVILFSLVLFFNSFSGAVDYWTITKEDVKLKVPKGFPKPSYDFSSNKLSPAVFVLGRKLFYDPIISRDSSISCASCHQRIAAFAHIDHKLSHGINGLFGTRNVPALQNLIFKPYYMWDGGVNNLEMQPINPITNPVEMDARLDSVIFKLRRSPVYDSLFFAAFGDSLINSKRLFKALAQFTGLMISSDSRYDRYMNKKDTLSAQELRGLETFRKRCSSCHAEPLFTTNSIRSNGIEPDTALNDIGYAKVTANAVDEYKFVIPSLRNVAMTYPYMHDGRYKSLEQVLDFYQAGKYYTRSADPLLKNAAGMSDDEKKDIIAFLKTLTDKTFLYDRRFADPNMSH